MSYIGIIYLYLLYYIVINVIFYYNDKADKATTLAGYGITDAASTTDLDKKAPISHASTDTTYGAGTTTKYGHCILVNSLDESSSSAGHVLSSYQGYVLDNKKVNLSGDTMTGTLEINNPGTASAATNSAIILGNNIAEGTDKSSYGYIRIFGRGTNYVNILDNSSSPISSNHNLYIPNVGGTIATVEEFTDESTATISYVSTYLSSGITVKKYGHLVILKIAASFKAACAHSVTFATIPTGFRPTMALNIPICHTPKNSTPIMGSVNIAYTTGALQFGDSSTGSSAIAAGAFIVAHCCYYVA